MYVGFSSTGLLCKLALFDGMELQGFIKGFLPKSNTPVAIKRISHESKQGLREFMSEIASIGRLRHRNLVQLDGVAAR
ncbi:hypothetical protein Nepgr_020889 [Nepenthes gracilis]|uniref:non-specific serine/threonine protein kinase n=1 Tax=Nepenthes gracilis TaxID=150966 RepID=A0AAD3XVM7_NEPGR|nr:hypothetical protein Nepgr_020889 [Nepenthes gracilis]